MPTKPKAAPRKKSSVVVVEHPVPVATVPAPAASEVLSVVEARVAQLRELAKTEPQRAQDETWNWFLKLGKARDAESLDELFRNGESVAMSGPTEGVLLMWLNPALHRLTMPLLGPGRFTMPWLGKTFDEQTSTGANRFKPWFPAVSKLAWPLYRGHRKDGDEDLMFDMDNGNIPDPLEPDHTIWKIDYQDVSDSPWFIRHCLDTLVEVTPDTHLGRLYYERLGGHFPLLYFALKQPVAS